MLIYKRQIVGENKGAVRTGQWSTMPVCTSQKYIFHSEFHSLCVRLSPVKHPSTRGDVDAVSGAAHRVVIIDPSWNPSHDLQAQDRAFRIGQRRDVSVYRLIAAGTLEEMIYTRQVYKQQQSAVATEGSKETRYFYGEHSTAQHSRP